MKEKKDMKEKKNYHWKPMRIALRNITVFILFFFLNYYTQLNYIFVYCADSIIGKNNEFEIRTEQNLFHT